MLRPLLVLLALAPLAGCLEGDPAGPTPAATFRLGGTFTENATQEDVADFTGLMAARGGTTAILESFPLQFAVNGLSGDACPLARAEAAAKAYVARVGECARERETGNPDEPTSTSASAT